MDTLTQCELRCGPSEHVAWIPTPGAFLGSEVTLDGLPGVWTVTDVYVTRRRSVVSDATVTAEFDPQPPRRPKPRKRYAVPREPGGL